MQTAIRLAAEHELMRRISVLGSLGYINADFAAGGGSSDLYDARLGAHYLLAANVSAGIEYNVAHRASSPALPT